MTEHTTFPAALGKYRIEKVLGEGAMGVVYEGFDPDLDRRVAIKTIRRYYLEDSKERETLERFRREAKAAGRCAHPNIVSVYDYGEDSTTPFIAMEFIEGRKLEDLINERVRFSLETIIGIMHQVLDGLGYCHRQGVFHRDLKPGNIIFQDDDSVKIADFGIARLESESSCLTRTGTVMGTPNYMSPEQFTGQYVDGRSDLFSAAIIMYELLTGERPFPGNAVATIMHRVLNVPAEPPRLFNVNLPPSFDDLIKKALAKHPDDRFQTADDFINAIRVAMKNRVETNLAKKQTAAPGGAPPVSAAGAKTVVAEPESLLQAKVNKTSWFGTQLAALIVLALGAGFFWWFVQDVSDEVPGKGAEYATRPKTEPAKDTPTSGVEMSVPDDLEKGVVNVTSEPLGASVYVDNQLVGVSPISFELSAGEHRIVLKKDRYHGLNAMLDVAAGAHIEFDIPLNPLQKD